MKHAIIEISISGVELCLAESNDKKEVTVALKDRTSFVVSDYFKSKKLLKGGVDEVIETVLKYKKQAAAYGIANPEGIILSFVEELENQKEILERLKAETGIEFKILQKEVIELCAKLVEKKELGKEGLIIVDSGKGGLRLSDVSGEEVISKYIPALGSTEISKEFVRSILPTKKEIEDIKKFINRKLKTKLLKKVFKEAILSGNAAISLGKMYADFYSEKYVENSFVIKAKKFKKLFDSLALNPRCATLISRYAPERINSVLANMLVMIRVMKKLGVKEATIKNYSYMEGYIFGLLNNCLDVPVKVKKAKKEKKNKCECKTGGECTCGDKCECKTDCECTSGGKCECKDCDCTKKEEYELSKAVKAAAVPAPEVKKVVEVKPVVKAEIVKKPAPVKPSVKATPVKAAVAVTPKAAAPAIKPASIKKAAAPKVKETPKQ